MGFSLRLHFKKKKNPKKDVAGELDGSAHPKTERRLSLRTFLSPGVQRKRKSVTNFDRVFSGPCAARKEKSNVTMMQRLVTCIRDCLVELDSEDFSDADLEKWAVLIFESMSAPTRMFHGIQHIFDVSHGISKPLPILGAFFHDIIYYTIDGGLSSDQAEVIKGIIDEEEGGVVRLKQNLVLPDGSEEDKLVMAVASIFNIQPGQTLNPFLGLNEFLSAVVAVRCLRDHLPFKDLAVIAACIEATIPFRKPDTHGNTVADNLYNNLKSTNDTFDMQMTQDELVIGVQCAIDLSNRDLDNFATPNHAFFLSNTWNLLHEFNIDLRYTFVYRISSFALAIKKMSTFFANLEADSLYNSFHNVPREEEIERLTMAAKKNIEIASRYLEAKLLAISVLAALAELTGGDAPISLFLGDLPEKNLPNSPGLEDYIQPAPRDTTIRHNTDVYNILERGREGGETQFDLQNSPLAAYLYGVLGEDGLDKSLKYAVCPMDEQNARLLLDSLPRETVTYIATPCAKLAGTRTEKLNQLVAEYSD
uniref:Uncharacterized protein n=1 Tax=Ditylum brightwellii TaxID=49249 RepID=A0A7S4SXI1_9STRA|mmetsp:Transcript_7366/g.9803  ORF Transcript_7366/g.9803 Transcript_7366/m.9803 type:complete len:534 (-) Transcript_7366:102-1703(-)